MKKSLTIRYYGYYKGELIFFPLFFFTISIYHILISGKSPEVFPDNQLFSIFNFSAIDNEKLRLILQHWSFIGIILLICTTVFLVISHFFHSIELSDYTVRGSIKSPFSFKRATINIKDIVQFGVKPDGCYFVKSETQEIVTAGKLGSKKEKLITDFLENHVTQP